MRLRKIGACNKRELFYGSEVPPRQGTVLSNQYMHTWLYAGTSGEYVGTVA